MKRGYSQNRNVSLSRWINGLISGDPDNMVSSDLHELAANPVSFRRHHPIRLRLYRLIEKLAPGHCAACHFDEAAGKDTFRDHPDDDWCAWIGVPATLFGFLLLFGGGWWTGLGVLVVFGAHYIAGRIRIPLILLAAYLLAVLLFAGCANPADPASEPDTRPNTEYGGPDDPATPENEAYLRHLTQEEEEAIKRAQNENR